MVFQKKHKFFIFSLVILAIATQTLASNTQIIEFYYSQNIYPFISNTLRVLFGSIGFSVGDLLYLFIILFIIYFSYKCVKMKFKFSKKNILYSISIVTGFYLIFHLFWGFNYSREPLSKILHFSNQKHPQEKLINLTYSLIDSINKNHLLIVRNKHLKVNNTYSFEQIKTLSIEAFNSLSKLNSNFTYTNPSIKTSLWSLPLTYMGFSGYINPFTNEAQINSIHPEVSLPTTTLHEISHQVGFGPENEANFIAYLAAIRSEDVFFKFSGYYMALRYCLSDINRASDSIGPKLIQRINPGILKNFEQQRNFHSKYDNPFEPIFKYTYNSYLLANKQTDGLKSYNKMVNLLLDYNLKYETNK